MSYDSTQDTKKHINQVIVEGVKFTSKLRSLYASSLNKSLLDMIDRFIVVLQGQLAKHDHSKLINPEKSGFDVYTPMLAKMEYGSDEYKKCLEMLKPTLDHHYKSNSHHPEHFANGIAGMNLYDLIEMFCDWQAAVKRNKNGDIKKSIDLNEKRFNMDKLLADMFRNTVDGNDELPTLWTLVKIFIGGDEDNNFKLPKQIKGILMNTTI